MPKGLYIDYIIACCNRPDCIRLGQHMFNTLCDYNLQLSKDIRGELTRIDPYYRDDLIPIFLDYVNTNWDKYNEE